MAFQPRVSLVPANLPVPMPSPIWAYCYARGFKTEQEIENLFRPKLKDLSHPFSISQMDRAVGRLLQALKAQETIGLYADYDLDGSPGLALLIDGLKQLGFQKLMPIQPSRLVDGYGFHEHFVDEFKKSGVSLIVTVDVGITDVQAVDYANQNGIGVIITDHHLPKENLPKALAVLNPNSGVCDSKLQHLCGTGVAFYLLLALKMEMEKQGLSTEGFQSKQLLDLFALATITDMVPLVKENRVLVKYGLKQLSETERPGLKQLLRELGFHGRALTSQDVAFRIAPKLNALTRLDEGIRAYDVLTAPDDTAKALVSETMNINERRRGYQDKAKKLVEQMLKDRDTSKYLFIYSHEFHPGVVSLIASDLMNRYRIPAFVGSVAADGGVVGSARSPNESINLQEVLGNVSSALVRFGGHQLAAGFEFAQDQAEKLERLFADEFTRLENAATENFTEGSSEATGLQSISHFDAEISLEDLSPVLIKWIDALGPFGMDFPAPRFLLKNVTVKSCRKLGGGFLKYTFEKGGRTVEAPWFSGARELPVGAKVNALVEPQMNEYMGRKTVQANLIAAELV